MNNHKLVTKKEFKEIIRPKLKDERDSKTIVLCHGVFDLVHPGHIIHFEQAKQMGDTLVVSITASKYVRKGPGRPYFNDKMRMKELAAIEYIDYVILSEGYTASDIIEAVEPDIYVKGQEYSYEDDDITGKISEERKLVERHGGRIAYTGGQVFSSTKLINTAMSGLPEDVISYMEEFKKKYSLEDIIEYARKAQRLKVLVVGDLIIDRYTYCTVQGLMSKDAAYSARMKNTENHLGGTAAIARHLSSFVDDVTFMTMAGSDDMSRLVVAKLQDIMTVDITYSHSFPTIVKHRFLSKNKKREEYRKIFVINNIPEDYSYSDEERANFCEKLDKVIEQFDIVFVCDFGHGLIDKQVIKIIEDKAKYIALNCQTNSSNRGLNSITKYHRADVYTVDQTELKQAFPELAFDEADALKSLHKFLGGGCGWLTRGAEGSWQIVDGLISSCPAFTLNVKDTIGAGDAFFALSCLFVAAKAPADVGSFMGNIAGACGANIVGNKESVEKVNAMKYASTLLNV